MTKRLKRFPASFRFVAVTFALVATASLATSAAADPPSAQQVQDAKDRVAQLAREVHAAQRQLDAISLRANEVAAEYDRELGRLEKLSADLLHTQLSLAQARARLRRDRGAAERTRADRCSWRGRDRTWSSCWARRRSPT